MTMIIDATPDLFDEMEEQALADRYTCVACGRPTCRCGRTPAEADTRPVKSTVSTDLVEDEPAMTLPEWVERHRHRPIDMSTLPVPRPAGPWYSSEPPAIGDDFPWGRPVIPSTPGYMLDPGKPDPATRAAMRNRRW